MGAETLLSRLQGVRRTGDGRWLSRCPAHEDRSPSLSVREVADGRVLLHCFAGCGAGDVLDAAGLDFADLFPEKLGHHFPRERRPFNAYDVLAALRHEATVVAIIAADVANGRPVNRERALLAAERIGCAIQESNHGR